MSVPDWALLTAVVGWVIVAVDVMLRLLALGVIPGNRQPSTGMAWLLLILVVPVLGFAIFALFGRTDLRRDRHARLLRAKARIRERTGNFDAVAVADDGSPLLPSVVTLNNRLGSLHMPATILLSAGAPPHEVADRLDTATPRSRVCCPNG